MKKIKLNSKGITLIALVVTVIVLIILVGVSINLILGENGIINKSTEAEHKHRVGRLLEKLELLKAPIQIDEHTVNLENYLKKLDDFTEEYNIKYVDKVDENNAYVILEEKYRFLIKDKEDGDVEIIYEGIVSTLILSETLGNYLYPESKTFTVVENESGGELSVSSSDENIATVTISGNIVTVQSETKQGTAIITVKSSATDKYGENKARYTAIVKNGTLNVTASPYNGAYDGSAHGITVTCTPNDAKIEYSSDGKAYSTTKPTYTNVGTYTTYYKVSKVGYKTVEGSLTVTLTKVTGDLTLSSSSGTYTYPTSGTFSVTNNVSGGTLTVSSSNNNIATATISGKTVTVTPGTTAGEASITVKSAETTNYNEKTVTYKATVKNGTLNVTASPYNGAYDGSAHGITVTCTPSDAKIEYSSDGKAYSTTKPTYTNVGTYTTYYKVSKAGYKTVEGSLTVTIKDTTVPSNATIVISGSTSVTTLPVSLSAKVTHTDNQSGVKIASCKYILNTSSTALGTNAGSYTGGTFSSNGQTITIKPSSVAKWYLHVLTVDNAGNAKETIKGPITVAAKYHTHSGNSSTGGGCYGNKVTKPIYKTCIHKFKRTIEDSNTQDTAYYAGSICGQELRLQGISYSDYSHSVLAGNSTSYSLNCGKIEGSTIDSYTISY